MMFDTRESKRSGVLVGLTFNPALDSMIERLCGSRRKRRALHTSRPATRQIVLYREVLVVSIGRPNL